MLKRWTIVLLFLWILAGCAGRSGGTLAWIDVPLNPTFLSEVAPVTIKGHASSPGGVSQVEVWVNGDLVDTIHDPAWSGNLAKFESTFSPTGPGEYTVQVLAVGVNGVTSEPDSAVVTIGQAAAALPPEEESEEQDPTPTFTPTYTPVPEEEEDNPVINYWAEPETIEAGGCTTIHWDVQNVSTVEFGGQNQEFQGSYHDCMCETQTYPMTVTYLDGTKETFRVTINVTGECEKDDPTPTFTPTPWVDNTSPPAPTPLKPVDGKTFSCLSKLMLRWTEVSDPSGISEYRILVQRHTGDNNWQATPGSPFTSTNTQKEISVGCGYFYRFSVRAVDGASNPGAWSNWSFFTVNLM